MYKFYCRLYQNVLRLVAYFLPWRKPELLTGEKCLNKLPQLIKRKRIDKLLIVTDEGVYAIGLMDDFLKNLENEEINFVVYDKTVPNPTINNIEEALQIYKEKNCNGIIAFGGGSPIDCAKGVGARVARPDKSISQMKGLFKVRKKLPPLIAIPTTAGTGSEATLAAVVTDNETHAKYAINDLNLIPQYTVLDPLLTVGLPPDITATTGMDALTHALEAYVGKSNTKETKKCSREAVQLIFANIYQAYTNGEDITARKNMQQASYLAGIAFGRAYVGYVHAIAHTLGGLYGTPHGLANAIILPYVLTFYGKSVYKPLAELADLVGITEQLDTNEQKAQQFIQELKNLNKYMNIPNKVSGINDDDIPLMVERALQEANPLYPVPKIMSRKDMFNIYQKIKR